MRDYIIATDSCRDFDKNLIRELDLTVIPPVRPPGTGPLSQLSRRDAGKPRLLHPPKQRGTCPDLCPQCGGL